MAVTQPPQSAAPEGQVAASPPAPMSSVQSRLRWMEITTRLLLIASIALFVWAALSIFLRPIARKLIEEPRYVRSPLGEPQDSPPPADFYRPEDEDGAEEPPPPRPRESKRRPRFLNPSDDDKNGDDKAELASGTTIGSSKLYGQPSEKSAELGEVRAGETVFVMKESPGWVLVLRGEGAMLGWMRRSNWLAER